MKTKLDHLNDLLEGNEQRLVQLEVGMETGEYRKKRKDITDEEKWAIAKRITQMELEVADFEEALVVIRKKIKDETKKQK